MEFGRIVGRHGLAWGNNITNARIIALFARPYPIRRKALLVEYHQVRYVVPDFFQLKHSLGFLRCEPGVKIIYIIRFVRA